MLWGVNWFFCNGDHRLTARIINYWMGKDIRADMGRRWKINARFVMWFQVQYYTKKGESPEKSLGFLAVLQVNS